MTTVTIPASLEEATSRLTGIDRLLTAKQWEKAAIVYAFVQVGATRAARADERDPRMKPRDFAALGITGLRGHQAVIDYWKAWHQAIEMGHAQFVRPGDSVVLPELVWEPTRPRIAKDQYAVERVARNDPGMIAEIVKLPDVAHEVAKDDESVLQVTHERKELAKQRATAAPIRRVHRVTEHSAQHIVVSARKQMVRATNLVRKEPPTATQREAFDLVVNDVLHLAAMAGSDPTTWTIDDREFLDRLLHS